MASAQDPSAFVSPATLLVRRAAPEVVGYVENLLAPPLRPEEVAHLAASRQVLVLADVGSVPGAAPLAAVAFEVDAGRRVARIRGIAVAVPVRRRGLGRRLFEGAMTLLRSEGFEAVEAQVPTEREAAFLRSVGFEPDDEHGPGRQFVCRL